MKNSFEQFSQSEMGKEEESKEIKIEVVTPVGSKYDNYEEVMSERKKILDDVRQVEDVRKKKADGELLTQYETVLLKMEDEARHLVGPEPRTGEKDGKGVKTQELENGKDISQEIKDLALAKFNIKEFELNELEGFRQLSEGRQKMVLGNLEQLAYGRAKEESAGKFAEANGKRGYFGRLWDGLSGADKLRLARLEKKTVLDLQNGGMAVHERSLKQLVSGMKEFGPEVKENDQVSYISDKEFSSLDPAEKVALEKFNKIAAEYGKLPEEYSFDTAKRKDRAKYEEMSKKYNEARKNILPLLAEQLGGEKEGMLRMNKAEFGVKMNQFVTNHPEVEKEITKIKEDGWVKILGRSFAEKGLYGGAGFAARSGAVASLGFLGAPIAAIGMGAWMGRKRAKEQLAKNEILGRKGRKDKSATDKAFAKGDVLATNLDRLINRIKREEDPEYKKIKKEKKEKIEAIEIKKEKTEEDKMALAKYIDIDLDELQKILNLRIEHTVKKLEEGRIDFGSSKKEGDKDILANKYFLLKKLSEASVIRDKAMGKHREVERKINELWSKEDEKTATARRSHLTKETLKGAGIAATFALGGALIRHFGEGLWELRTRTADASQKIGEENVVPKGETAKNIQSVKIGAETEGNIAKETLEESTLNKKGNITPERLIPENNTPEGKLYQDGMEKEASLPVRENTPSFDNFKELLEKDFSKHKIIFQDGAYKIKDYGARGFDLVVKKAEDGSVKFGIDGPLALGKYNWGAEGKSWLFKADADYTEENLKKALAFIKKADDSFYKGPSDYTKQGWSE
ncbi:hypothetical protein C4572_00050 [Candidatus Parcubacteria bacterium]|nr:MAG: hypothetical protein C4572_00050 [Candidatus Parcubacteria bacterium]